VPDAPEVPAVPEAIRLSSTADSNRASAPVVAPLSRRELLEVEADDRASGEAVAVVVAVVVVVFVVVVVLVLVVAVSVVSVMSVVSVLKLLVQELMVESRAAGRGDDERDDVGLGQEAESHSRLWVEATMGRRELRKLDCRWGRREVAVGGGPLCCDAGDNSEAASTVEASAEDAEEGREGDGEKDAPACCTSSEGEAECGCEGEGECERGEAETVVPRRHLAAAPVALVLWFRFEFEFEFEFGFGFEFGSGSCVLMYRSVGEVDVVLEIGYGFHRGGGGFCMVW